MTELGLGVLLPSAPIDGGWGRIGAVAAEAEAVGAGAVWLTDHLFWHGSAADAPTALALVAAATVRATIGPCVLQLPLRSTAAVAKSMAFLDALAPGRVVVGVGVGEHQAEYEAAGLADRYHRRGALLDDAIIDLQTAWTRTGSLTMEPSAPLPIWVGGRSERARQRAARCADGWIPHLCPPSWFADQMGLLDEDLAAAGRSPGDLVRGAVVAVSVDGIEPDTDPAAWLGRLYALDPRVFRRVLLRGSAAEVASQVRRFADAGAGHVALLPAGDHPVDHLGAIVEALR